MRAVTNVRRMRVAVGVLAGACSAVVAIGWLHTAAGRVLLTRLGVACPVNTVDPKVVFAMRNDAMLRTRGSTPAPARPALGLLLDRSTRQDVSRWALRTHAQCDALSRGYRFLRCRGLPAPSLGIAGPPISEIWFSFDAGDRLVAINLYRRGMTEEETRRSWRAAVDRLHESLGQPMASTGDASLDRVFKEPVAVARVRYAYSDYMATVTASHLPYGGLAVREQYMSTVETPPVGGPRV